jgi:glutamyl-tRNA synthetase
VEKAEFFFKEEVVPVAEELIGKNLTAAESIEVLEAAEKIIESLPAFDLETIEEPMRGMVETLGWKAGQVFGVLRVAITGQQVSPPLFESMEIIGKKVCVERVRKGIELLRELQK